MRARTSRTKITWCALVALGATVGACADQSPTEVAAPSPTSTAAFSTSANTVARVIVYPLSYTLRLGQVKQMVVIPKNSSGTTLSTSGRRVTWASSNPAVASVNSTGVVTARAGGLARIVATVDGVRGTSDITVNAPLPVASLTVTPASKSIVVNEYVQLTATPKDASGRPVSGYTITWTSSNPAVARVYSNGLVKALARGSATIRASAGGKTGSAAITVTRTSTSTPPPDSGSDVASVIVYPLTYTLNVGQAKQMIAIPRDSRGQTLSTSGRTVIWRSSNTAVATVSSTGLVIGRASGTTTITVSVDGTRGSSTIMVTTPY